MTSFLKGLVAGATVALLYAPYRGEEARGRLRAEVEALLERLSARAREAQEALMDQFEEARERVAGAPASSNGSDGRPGD
ncbi:MAG: YtxH domain-containing protein [Gemmatimonadota bacterium]